MNSRSTSRCCVFGCRSLSTTTARVPEPLPNLEFKIICGDSLLGPDPTPETVGAFSSHWVRELKVVELKAKYLDCHDHSEQDALRQQILSAEAKIREAFGSTSLAKNVVDWSAKFSEVFADRKGFDVVVANPPYVRQEKIGSTKAELRKEYADSTVARSDLYCYFYVRGLQLLRSGGMHVFVCSNSWLDVGYGAKLQEYLLKKARVDTIYESAIERQFSTAQINTIISVVSRTEAENDHLTKFVSLRDEFKSAIADPSKRRETLMNKGEILKASQMNPVGKGTPKFVGDKWGAKYLRAPDIYRTVLARGEGKLVRLGDVATVKRGITTGANEFFYLKRDEIASWGIEEAYLKPLIKGPRESNSIEIDTTSLPHKAFVCHENKRTLRGRAALDYINWGESRGFQHKSSLAARNRWWDLGRDDFSKTATNIRVGSTARTLYTTTDLLFDKAFYQIDGRDRSPLKVCAAMNSTVLQLMINVAGRVNLGGGVLEVAVYELAELLVVDPQTIPEFDVSLFRTTDWNVLSPSPERRLIDDAVFDVLGLTQGERDGVYEGVRELVENRMRRARSV